MNSPLKTSVEIATETVGPCEQASLTELAQLDFPGAIAAGVERVLAGKDFTAEELAAESLRFEIARQLAESRYFESVAAAQEFIEILSAATLGRELAPGMSDWLAAHRALLVQTRELRARGVEALRDQQELRAAEKEVARIADALSFEKQRMESWDGMEARGRENYFAHIVGQRFIHGLRAVEFMKTWLAEKEVVRFTRDVVIPELERQLAAAQQRVSDLRSPTAIISGSSEVTAQPATSDAACSVR